MLLLTHEFEVAAPPANSNISEIHIRILRSWHGLFIHLGTPKRLSTTPHLTEIPAMVFTQEPVITVTIIRHHPSGDIQMFSVAHGRDMLAR